MGGVEGSRDETSGVASSPLRAVLSNERAINEPSRADGCQGSAGRRGLGGCGPVQAGRWVGLGRLAVDGCISQAEEAPRRRGRGVTGLALPSLRCPSPSSFTAPPSAGSAFPTEDPWWVSTGIRISRRSPEDPRALLTIPCTQDRNKGTAVEAGQAPTPSPLRVLGGFVLCFLCR